MATSAPHDPMDDLVDFEGSGDDAPEEPRDGPSTPPGSAATGASAETAPTPSLTPSLPAILDVYSAAISPAQWAEMSATLRAGMVATAPLTVQRVHSLDEAALAKQVQLEDEATAEALKDATDRHLRNRDKMVAIEAKKHKLQQQLEEADRQLTKATSDTESTHKAVGAAEKSPRALEASRRRSGRSQGSGRSPSPDRISPPFTTRPSPRTFRDVVFPPSTTYEPQVVDSTFMDTVLGDFVRHSQPNLGRPTRNAINTAAQALMDTFLDFQGATLRLVFRHVDTAPSSPVLTSAAHSLVTILRRMHSAAGPRIEWPNRSLFTTAASSPRRQFAVSSPRHGRRDSGRQGRTDGGRQGRSDGNSSSHRNSRGGGQRKNRRNDSSSGSPRPAKGAPKKEPDDSDDVEALKTPS